jgi:hypothetical protein
MVALAFALGLAVGFPLGAAGLAAAAYALGRLVMRRAVSR